MLADHQSQDRQGARPHGSAGHARPRRRGDRVKRREFIAALGGAAAWPLAGDAQQPERVRRIGWVTPVPENSPTAQARVRAFAQAMGHLGWVEGKNLRINYRFGAGELALN